MIEGRAFDNEKYLERQTKAIFERVKEHNNKLYIEFGGKLVHDSHAARVLPGYDPSVKMRLLQEFRDNLEVIICVYSGDIEKRKIRADVGITYDAEVLKLIDQLNQRHIKIAGVVITRFEGQPTSVQFRNRLRRRGIRVYTHKATIGYPTDIDAIVSSKGYGANPDIETERPIVAITGPGPGSGKLATCLSQLYHDYKKGIRSGYAKFETFPVWNLPLKHPLNVAYEAATADLGDVNLIDHFHLEAYNEKTVNYNRDIEAFPLLKRILERITNTSSFYKSPTDMGVNSVAFGIIDDELVRKASRQEIIRRYFSYSCEYALGKGEKQVVEKIELLMDELDIKIEERAVVQAAREAVKMAEKKGKGVDGIYSGAALELPDGRIVTGKNFPLLHSSSSLILNAAKELAGIPDDIDLLPNTVIQSLEYVKKDILQETRVGLDLEETLISLSISAAGNPAAAAAVEKIKELRGCEVHLSHMPTPGDEAGLRKVGVNVTCDPLYPTNSLYEC
jgi:uncharacterized protein (UPF0371 family)